MSVKQPSLREGRLQELHICRLGNGVLTALLVKVDLTIYSRVILLKWVKGESNDSTGSHVWHFWRTNLDCG